jgi:uncharacterized membrane protein
MNSVTAYLMSGHWLAAILLAFAVLLFVGLLWQRQRTGQWSLSLLLAGSALFLLGAGGLGIVPAEYGLFGAAGVAGIFVVLLIVVILTGSWWAPLGYALGALLLGLLGAGVVPMLGQILQEFGAFLATLEPLEPWWLLMLLLIPLLVWWSFRSLVGLGTTRRILALTLRSLLVLLLALALSETHAKQPDRNLTVMFLWDRSLSIPAEWKEDVDLREQRILHFINAAVEQRGTGHEDDRVGVIVFGRRPRLELPPAAVKRIGFKKVLSQLDNTYTDIGGAIKLALATFPEGTAKRVVIISDGNENLGLAEEQARIARQNGVQIDVVPIAAVRRNLNEVLVERVEAPPFTDKDARVPLRIILRSFNPQVVVGTLTLTKSTLVKRKNPDTGNIEPYFDKDESKPTRVKLKQGLNVFYMQQPGSKKEDSYSYEAKFIPELVETADGFLVHKGLPGDQIENNRASVNVIVRGERSLLFIEPRLGDHQLLLDRLRAARPNIKIHTITPEKLNGIAETSLFLSQYDCVVLANVPADELDEKLHKAIRSNTYDQGSGLIMIGGPQSFGAGGWQNTEIEKALPVTMDIKSMKVESKSGLVMMMHASEMAEGNAWQRKIAKLAIEKLSPADMVGMLYFDHGAAGGGHVWHIPFGLIGPRRAAILGLVNTMTPGDMPDCDPAFVKAYTELTKAEYDLGTKHIIFISDGDHWAASPEVLKKIRDAKITCTTVCITTHGATEVQKMKAIADFTRGRSYHITKPDELPAIYIKESRLVSQSFVHEGKIQPEVKIAHGPTEGLNKVEPLFGFVRTTRRPSALVEVPIESPKVGGYKFPILAEWQYGLGRSVAFTSDARTEPGGKPSWDRDWANSDTYMKFWEQTVDWALRPTETGKHLRLSTEQRDGKIRIIVEAREIDKTPLTNIEEFKAGITVPSLKSAEARKFDLKFEQKSSGVYEAAFPADEVGTYFINIRAKWKKDGAVEQTDSVRAGVTVPYSPEFAEMESNPALLEKLREVTGGNTYSEDETSLRRAAQSGDIFRAVPAGQPSLQPLWPWLVLLTAIVLLLDIAVRRIALEPRVGWTKAVALWSRLRGQAEVAVPEFLERLQSRKAQVDETLERHKASRRFQSGDTPAGPVETAGGPVAPPSATPAAAPPPLPAAPAKQEEATDYASRLLKAKKRAIEEREKKNKPQ